MVACWRSPGHRQARQLVALRVVGVIGISVVAWAVWRSKTESKELREMEAELTGTAEKTFETVGSGV